MNKRLWLVSGLVLLASVKADDCNYVSIIFPVATDSCVTTVNATGSYSAMATCKDNGDITFSYWMNGDCSGDVARTEDYTKDEADANDMDWYCDSDNSGDDCDRTLYRYYTEESCDSNEYYTEFYIVNNVCASWSLSENGESSQFTCEDDVMFASVYQGTDCNGDPVQKENFTSGCTNNHKLTVTCVPAGEDGDNNDDDDDESSAMAAFGSISSIILIGSLLAAFM